MDLLHPEFVSFLKCASKNNLRYLLIGGYAVNFYGYNRNTQDLDVWIAPTKENKFAFIQTLLCMNYSSSEISHLNDKDFTVPFKADIGTADVDIDVLTYVHHTINFNDAEANKEVFTLEDGVPMNFVSYNYLIDIKLKAARPKDFFDIEQLEKINKK
jgi:hypothetical protein